MNVVRRHLWPLACCLLLAAALPAWAGEGEEPRVTTERPTIYGSMDRTIVERVVGHRLDELQTCYDDALTDDATLAGRLVVKWVVLSTGFVKGVGVEEDDVGSESLAGCVTTAIEGWQFPAAKGGGIVIVSMPFVFSPG